MNLQEAMTLLEESEKAWQESRLSFLESANLVADKLKDAALTNTIIIDAPCVESSQVPLSNTRVKVTGHLIAICQQSRYDYDIARHYLPRSIEEIGLGCRVETGLRIEQHWMNDKWLLYFASVLPSIVTQVALKLRLDSKKLLINFKR